LFQSGEETWSVNTIIFVSFYAFEIIECFSIARLFQQHFSVKVEELRNKFESKWDNLWFIISHNTIISCFVYWTSFYVTDHFSFIGFSRIYIIWTACTSYSNRSLTLSFSLHVTSYTAVIWLIVLMTFCRLVQLCCCEIYKVIVKPKACLLFRLQTRVKYDKYRNEHFVPLHFEKKL
jgi:hypothetical protein